MEMLLRQTVKMLLIFDLLHIFFVLLHLIIVLYCMFFISCCHCIINDKKSAYDLALLLSRLKTHLFNAKAKTENLNVANFVAYALCTCVTQ